MERLNKVSQRGFALLDVLVALLIASAALLTILGGAGLSARSGRKAEQRILELIAARSAEALTRAVIFQAQRP
jgi:Tfp pilus assembly protein PilV